MEEHGEIMRTSRFIAALSAGALCLGTLIISPTAIAEILRGYDSADSSAAATSVVLNADDSTGASGAESGSTTATSDGETPSTPAKKTVTVVMERTDKLGSTVYEGDIVTYHVKYTNNSSSPVAVIPKSGNFAGLLTNNRINCRWGSLKPGQTATCKTPKHKIAWKDLQAGSFDPTTTWTVAKDHAGKEDIEDDVASEPTTPLTVARGTRENPATPTPAAVAAPAAPVAPATAASGGDAAGESSSGGSESGGSESGTTTNGGSTSSVTNSTGDGAATAANETPAASTKKTLTIVMTRTDTLGSPVHKGDIVKYNVTYTNNSDQTVTAFPKSGSFAGLLATDTPNCRWANLQPKKSATCRTATHTITDEDVTKGLFNPKTVWKATQDRAGNTLIEDNIESEPAETITVSAEPRELPPDPATIPTEREDGVAVRLAHGGENGFSCYRIPAVTEAPNGWILAAWDGRPANCADAPQANSIVQRISKDGGKSWEPMKVVAQGHTGSGKYGYSDPSYVVDETTGKIFLFFVKSFDVGIWGSQPGTAETTRNILHAAVTESSDNGVTWSDPKVITNQITKDGWKGRFATSGRGIQKKYGPQKGRLIQQYSVTGTGINKLAAVSVYSDDHGATWKAGDAVGSGMDENKVVELSDGRLMLNSRASDRVWARKIAYSTDGGETWGPVTVEHQLPDPHNNAHILRAFPDAPEGSDKAKILLYSSSSGGGRTNGLVRISWDDGKTWSAQKQFKSGYMAYSVMTTLTKTGGYGLLYEGDNNDIMYTHVSIDWLGALPVVIRSEATRVRRGKRSLNVTLQNMGETEISDVTVHASAPTGWTVTDGHVDSLAPGAETTVSMDVTVPVGVDAGNTSIPVSITTGGKRSSSIVPLNVNVLASEATAPVAVVLANEPAAQNGTPASNILDGNVNTIYHSPWNGSAKLPINIDLKTASEKEERIVRIDLTGRNSGGNNGRFKTVDVYTGTSADNLTLTTTATLADNANRQSIYLDTQASYIRLAVRETYGSQPNTFASLAELGVRTAAVSAVGKPETRSMCYLSDTTPDCAHTHLEALTWEGEKETEDADEDASGDTSGETSDEGTSTTTTTTDASTQTDPETTETSTQTDPETADASTQTDDSAVDTETQTDEEKPADEATDEANDEVKDDIEEASKDESKDEAKSEKSEDKVTSVRKIAHTGTAVVAIVVVAIVALVGAVSILLIRRKTRQQ